MRHGFIVAMNGWAGDVEPGADVMSIEVPVASNRDGTPIVGKVVAESIPSESAADTMDLPYAAAHTSGSNGTLTMRERYEDRRIQVAGWKWVNPRRISFPGPPRAEWIYEFVYDARDPTVMGIGHAATRDFLAFLRTAERDDFGNPNPVAMPGGIRAIYSWGRSQGGRVERDFLYWGFNEDETGRIVIDGMMPYATGAAGRMWMNFRFAQPTVSAQHHSRHHSREPEFPHTFPVLTDPLTGQTDGILRRCLASRTCPKFFAIDGANEYWQKSSSLNHTDGSGRDLDISRLAPNVRVYSIAGIEHNTVFDERPALLAACQQMTNPLYNGPVFRALAIALDRWVVGGVLPPPSRVPGRSDGTLVPAGEVRFPAIPATAYAGWPALPAVEFQPRSASHNVPMDFSRVPPEHRPGRQYVVLVSQVDRDGNELGGIRLPHLQAPLGTHTGWSLMKPGAGGPDLCGQNGQFIPFANTRAERVAANDPRLSLEERYPSPDAHVMAVSRAAAELVEQGFLLEEDEKRIVTAAKDRGFLLWRAPDAGPTEPSAGSQRR
jgi:hypothetical protein